VLRWGSAFERRGAETLTTQKPAVNIKKSISPEYIICLEDGKKLKMLKRYLRSRYGLSPEDYRAKWGLPADYPMVAPNYAAQRSEFAKKWARPVIASNQGAQAGLRIILPAHDPLNSKRHVALRGSLRSHLRVTYLL
jgi:hypothetical protein